MGLFKKKPAAEPALPDEALPFFARDQADRFRRTLAAAFAEHGLEVEVRLDHLVDSQGREFGLHTLATACFNDERGERAWSELTRDHARRILAAINSPATEELGSTEAVLAHVFPRLVDTLSIGQLPLGYSTEFSDGVVEVLNLDLPDSVLTLNDDHVAQHGGRSQLRAAGIRNLLGVLAGLEVESLSGGEASLLVMTNDSMFTASTVLVMPELLARIGVTRSERGVLVCLPFRHQVAVHEIRDASVVPSLNAMVNFALTGYKEGAGPVTPHVFWWRSGTFEQLTRSENGRLSIYVDAELQTVLDDVCN